MTDTIMLQAKDGFVFTSELINSMKQLFGEKINVVEINNKIFETSYRELNQADTIKLKQVLEQLEQGKLEFYSFDEMQERSKNYLRKLGAKI